MAWDFTTKSGGIWKFSRQPNALTIIHVTSVPDAHHQDHEAIIFNTADHAIIPDAIPPESCKGRGQRFAERARTGSRSDPLFEVIEDTPLDGAVELLQVTQRATIKFNRPAQGFVSLPQD
jgi:hypothetical protein